MKEWDTFLSYLEKELGKSSVDKWLRNLKISSFDARNLYLKPADSFQISWFNEHVKPRLNAFVNTNFKQIKVHFDQEKKTKKQQEIEVSQPISFNFDKIDPFYHFSNFLFSEKNLITQKLFSQLTGFCFSTMTQKKPTMAYSTFNPIFIYGTKNTGKTHLLTAIAKQFMDLSLNVMFVNAETFTRHVVASIRGGYMPTFRKRYRLADVLILEDIHLLANRAATQEEFFHTFNALHTSGKQIILSANFPPHLLSGIEPRLTSRFEWGITCSLDKLDKTELQKALELRQNFLKIKLSDQQRQFLMQSFKTQEDLLKAFDVFILRVNDNLSKTEPKQMEILLKDLINETQKNSVTPQRIVYLVASFFELHEQNLLEKNQSKEFAYPRQIAIYLMRKDLRLPFTKIATIFKKDHSTIMSSVKKIEQMKDKKTIEAIEKIRNEY